MDIVLSLPSMVSRKRVGGPDRSATLVQKCWSAIDPGQDYGFISEENRHTSACVQAAQVPLQDGILLSTNNRNSCAFVPEVTGNRVLSVILDNRIWESQPAEPLSARCIHQDLIAVSSPYRGQFDSPRTMQQKLNSAQCSIFLQFDFRHRKMELKQIFPATQHQVYKFPQLIQ